MIDTITSLSGLNCNELGAVDLSALISTTKDILTFLSQLSVEIGKNVVVEQISSVVSVEVEKQISSSVETIVSSEISTQMDTAVPQYFETDTRIFNGGNSEISNKVSLPNQSEIKTVLYSF